MKTTKVTPKQFIQALSVLRSQTRSNIEANQITALMRLREAGEGGLSVGEVGDAVGITHVSASRMVRVLGCHGLKANKESGWGVVEIYYDHTRPRATMARLNKKGIKAVDDFLEMLSN
tara:strand:+ start:8094 stop:8447 length:354 start_codon:yes stop_codon:yes gene_type:complete